ncbi:MAG: Ig-like domain-containing protein [Actinobacteria bacterium]|nr:Ig-like domain-containing protein [Actinomycetota bacterium]
MKLGAVPLLPTTATTRAAAVLAFFVVVWLAFFFDSRLAHAETFAVNSTGDAGDQSRGNGFCNTAPFQVGTEPECTLRAAIEEANATTAADTISFNIGGSGVKTISPMAALPDITEAVTIDGYSEPGASPNTLDTGTDAALKIELSGANAVLGAIGLRITSRDSVVKGLIINRFGYGVTISGAGLSTLGNNKIEGNYIGTDASGTADLGNSRAGVQIVDAAGNVVGGTSAAARNTISGNTLDGVFVDGLGANRIEGNYIGTDANGTADLGNGEDGVTLLNAATNVVGGTSATAHNIISGNGNDGVTISGTDSGSSGNNNVMGNYVGTDASGTANLGNDEDGVDIDGDGAPNNTIGGTEAGARNIISGNDDDGVDISNTFGNRILSNSIHSNGALGIDLGADGVTANDPKDPDTGPNTLQNYPVITSVTSSSGQTTIKGTLNSIPNAGAFTLQFFGSPTADPSGFGEGRTLVGETLVTTDSNGDASFDFATTTPLAGGQVVTATATRNGNTSEFSRAVDVVGTTAPTVSGTTPTAGATSVARNISPTATFSEEMDPDTLTASTAKVYQRVRKKIRRHGKVRRVWRWVPVSAEVSYDGATKTVTLNPYGTSETLLAPSRRHLVVISTGAKDKAGNALVQNYYWTFTTGIS